MNEDGKTIVLKETENLIQQIPFMFENLQMEILINERLKIKKQGKNIMLKRIIEIISERVIKKGKPIKGNGIAK